MDKDYSGKLFGAAKNAKLQANPEVRLRLLATGDCILAVNGVHGDVNLMLQEIEDHKHLYFRLGRFFIQSTAAQSSQAIAYEIPPVLTTPVAQQLSFTEMREQIIAGGFFVATSAY